MNTASTKLLMRQNPSGINLVSNSLRLNEFEENYLLSAKKGQGLIITEDNSYCFFIEASPKVHELITTNPNEKKIKTEQKETKKVKVDLRKSFFIKSELLEAEILELMKKGYITYRTRITSDSLYVRYLLKVRQNESPEHAFLCWYLQSLFPKNAEIKVNVTSDPDIEVSFNNKKICFEVETGKRIDKVGRKKFYERFLEEKTSFDRVFVIVPNERVARKYYDVCNDIITKAELKEALLSLFHTLSI